MKNLKNFKVLATLLVLVASAGFALAASADNGLSKGKSGVSHLYLYEKDSSWDVVDGGAWAKLTFNAKNDKYVFNGHNLAPNLEYTLVNYGGWPTVAVLGEGVSDKKGNVHIQGTFDVDKLLIEGSNDGAKIWLVPTSDIDGEAFTTWNPSSYLFEYDLV